MKQKKWKLSPSRPNEARLLEQCGYSCLAARVLAARGLGAPEEAARFLSCRPDRLLSPLLLPDMSRAVTRIRRALAGRERIAVYGDYDVDGITAAALLTRYLRSLGADCTFYIPDRIREGYGLNPDSVTALKARGASLLVTVDCGVASLSEVEQARSLGMDVIVTDHHQCKDALPEAAAVVNPCRPDGDYPFPALAGVGVALKLVLALGGPEREAELFEQYSPLAAVGTVADVVSMTGENRAIVGQGIAALPRSGIVGLHELLRAAGLKAETLTATQIGFTLAPRINAAGRLGRAELAAELLLTDDSARAAELATELCALNVSRRELEQAIFGDAVRQAEALPSAERSALVLASGEWHPGVAGIVAARLAARFAAPCFLICLTDGIGKGSCRSFGEFNIFSALDACSDLLLGYGGHALAAGFSIREEAVPAFRARMNRAVLDYLAGEMPEAALDVDVSLDTAAEITLENVEALSLLEPFGPGNLQPVFCLNGVQVQFLKPVGGNQHLKLRLRKGNVPLDGIFFSADAETLGIAQNDRIDLAFYLQINEFRGNRTVQLQVLDIHPAGSLLPEEEAELVFYRKHVRGQPLTAEEALRLIPSRDEFAAAWRYLRRSGAEEGIEQNRAALVRDIARRSGQDGSLSRALVCLDVFSERGLIDMKTEGSSVRLSFRVPAEKVNLADSEILISLRRGSGAAQ